MAIKTNKELVAALQNVVNNYKTVYMWGVFGSPVTESIISQKASQYPSWYTAARQKSFRALIGKGYFGFDCVCLIKGLLWGWNGNAAKTYGGATYATNGVPDIGADAMITKCSGVSTNFSSVEIGEALWCSGHIGVYIGDGKAIECTPSWSNNVQITAVKNMGTISGLNARTWTKHGKLPYITYEAGGTSGGSSSGGAGTSTSGSFSVGDIVQFAGGSHYASSTASKAAATPKAGPAKITAIAAGKAHPYHIINTDGTSSVYGWVDAGTISKTGSSSGSLKVGDKVKVQSGAKDYTGKSLASFVYSTVYDVQEIGGDRAVIGLKGVVTAAVKTSNLIKQ